MKRQEAPQRREPGNGRKVAARAAFLVVLGLVVLVVVMVVVLIVALTDRDNRYQFQRGTAATTATPTTVPPVTPQEFLVDGKVFGSPGATVRDVTSRESADTSPVSGATVSMAPYLEPLPEGPPAIRKIRIDTVGASLQLDHDVRYTAWTFGGSVPGPVIHIRRGDRVHFTSVNRSDEALDIPALLRRYPETSPYGTRLASLNPQGVEPAIAPMTHAVDFHAATTAPETTWVTYAPGQAIELEWVANYPGIFSYHNGMPSRTMNTGMGMHGVVIVSPREGYPTDDAVARSYVLIRQEHYLVSASDHRDQYEWDHQAALDHNPSQVTLNGHMNLLHAYPLVAQAGERLRLYLLNQGPNQASTVHITGVIFDRVWVGGSPDTMLSGQESVRLEPGQGAIAEFIAPAAGQYTLMHRRMSDEEPGATATIIVEPRDRNGGTP